MLNLNCVICADLFKANDDVHVTKCGHLFHYPCLLQWLERSKTCPQCRNKCTGANVHRVYFNLANLDASRIDVGSLQEQLDNANLKIKVGENDLHKAEDQIKCMRQSLKKCMKTIASLEQKVKSNDFLVLSYAEQLKIVKEEAQQADALRKEVKRLKEQITMMENVSSILTATAQDAEKMLKEENNPATLAVWVTTLKRELRTCESKKTDLRNILKVVQNDLRKESELRRKKEERIVQLESDNHILLGKVERLESAKVKEKLNTGYIVHSPSTSISDTAGLSSLQNDTKRLTISPTVSRKAKEIEDSDSPYLNIKSSGVPLNLLNNVLFKKDNGEKGLAKFNSDLSDKYSIFKKPRMMNPPDGISNLLNRGYMYDGMGGSEPIIDDEETTTRRSPFKKTSAQSLSNRLKAGKLRKFPSAGPETIDKFLNKA